MNLANLGTANAVAFETSLVNQLPGREGWLTLCSGRVLEDAAAGTAPGRLAFAQGRQLSHLVGQCLGVSALHAQFGGQDDSGLGCDLGRGGRRLRLGWSTGQGELGLGGFQDTCPIAVMHLLR